MNSSSGSRCSILDFVLAVVVTLGRCERCWSGALSRNSHRGSINLWCPADKRPTDRLGAVTLGNIQSGFLAALGWIFAKRSLTHSWVRLSTSHPRRAVNRWATTQCPLRLAAMQLWVGCVSTLRTLRVSRVVFDIKTLLGGLGGLPHLLTIFFYLFSNLYKIYRKPI